MSIAVTTTSSKVLSFGARRTSIVEALPTLTSLDSNPTNEKVNTWLFATEIEKVPALSVLVATLVPLTRTETLDKGDLSYPTTLPVTNFCCALAIEILAKSTNNKLHKPLVCINLNLW